MVEAIGTQPEAADIAGVSLRQLKQYLAGDAAPSMLAMGALAAATGFSIDWLVSGLGNKMRSARSNVGQKDAALESGIGMRETLAQIREVKDLFNKLGVRVVTNEEEDEVISGMLDVLDDAGVPEAHHLVVLRVVAAALRRVLEARAINDTATH